MKNKTKDRIFLGIIHGILGMVVIGVVGTAAVILGIEAITGEPITVDGARPIMIACLVIGAAVGAYYGSIVCVNFKYKEKADMIRIICDECKTDNVEVYVKAKWVTTPHDRQYARLIEAFEDKPNGYCNNCQKEVEIVREPYYTKEELNS